MVTDRAEAVRRRREAREALLLAIYDAVNGVPVPMGRIRPEGVDVDGFTERELEDAVEYLSRGGLVDRPNMAQIGLTMQGIDSVEEMIAPSVDSLEILDVVELRKVEAFTTQAETMIERGEVDADDETLDEIRDLLHVIQTQLGKRPRKRFIAAGLALVRDLAVGAGASVLVQAVPTLVG